MGGEVKKDSSEVMRSKLLIVLGIVAAVIGVGIGVGYLAGGGASHPAPVVAQASAPETQPPPVTVVTHPPAPAPAPLPEVKPEVAALPVVQTSNLAVPDATSPETETNWDEKIDGIIGSDDADTNKVKQLFALFPQLPPDGQEEAAQHLSNLVEDENYAPLGEMLKNDKLSEGVLDELLADALNRPNSLKLPVLVDVASDPNNPKHDEAKDLVELYLGDDFPGNQGAADSAASAPIDWSKVRTVTTNWLQQNPD